MPQIGTIKVETGSGTVDVPVYSEGDSGSNVYEFLKVKTESGTGFIPLVEPAEAAYNYIRIQTENNGVVAVHTETALGAPTIQNYIEDDWNDNKLQNRDNKEDGIYPYPQSFESSDSSSSEYDQGRVAGDVLIGRYRPEWKSHVSGLTANNQGLETNSNNSYVYSINSKATVLTVSIDFRFISKDSNNGKDYWGFGINEPTDYTDKNNGNNDTYFNNAYHIGINDNGNYNLTRAVGGNRSGIIDGSGWEEDGNWHTGKATRNNYSNFELFYDETSQGTTTDKHITKFNAVGLAGDMRYRMQYDNLVVR